MDSPRQLDHGHPRGAFRDPILRVGDAVAILIEASGRASDAQMTDILRAATGEDRLSIGRRTSGRPMLLPPLAELGVSIARRGTFTAAGFDARMAVGVDLERDDPSLDCVRVARDHFAAREAEQIGAESLAGARDLFLRLWCAKEAILKITGRGVVDGMDEPDLSGALDNLRQDGSIVTVPGRGRCPAARVAARRLVVVPEIFYVALAVAS